MQFNQFKQLNESKRLMKIHDKLSLKMRPLCQKKLQDLIKIEFTDMVRLQGQL